MSILSSLILVFVSNPVGDVNAKQMLAELREFQKAQMTEARTSPAGGRAAMAAVEAKAKEMVAGTTVKSIAPEEGYDYSQIFALAKMNKEALESIEKFIPIASNDLKFTARLSAVGYAYQLSEIKKVEIHVVNAMPTTGTDAVRLASGVGAAYASALAETQGWKSGINLIDKVDKNIQSLTTLTGEERAKVRLSLTTGKVDILADAKREKDALKLIDEILPSLDDKSGRSLKAKKAQITMIGSAAPSITHERQYGEYSGLESLKGKVVVLDFFAHWCGPCRMAFPALREMYADLKPKGLEIIGVTTYYGYIGQEQMLSPDVEFEKMKDFKASEGMTWPIIFGSRDNFNAYGVTGIPHVAVLDRAGKVREIKIGYTPKGMVEFRATIEKMLKE